MTVADRAIVTLVREIGLPDCRVVEVHFDTWMQKHHPDDAAAVDFADLTIQNAQLRGELRAEYGAKWAAYLEAEGCTFDEGC